MADYYTSSVLQMKNRSKQMRKVVYLSLICSILNITLLFGQKELKTDTLNFVFEGKKLSGYIDVPKNTEPVGIVIIVPGHGKTSFNKKFWYYDSLYKNFGELGLATFRYDKTGCGDSQGKYNHEQSVYNSAKEIISAINELKRRDIPGSDKIGLWGISRAGYICPLVIQEYPSIAFWISVSGTDGLNSYPYKLKSDLVFAGLTEAKAKLFVSEYLQQKALIENGGTYKEYVDLKLKQAFRKNEFFMSYMNIDREFPKSLYDDYQRSLKVTYKRDKESNIRILVSDFDKILNEVKCPVLAIMGEKDFIVDWKKTLLLYNKTIGAKNKDILTVKTFPNGNHSLLKCKTGAPNERLESMEFCDGYIDSMTIWLKHVLDK